MIFTGLLHVHSAIRYAIVIFLIGSLFTAWRGLAGKRSYTASIRKWHLTTRALVNLQMFIGLILYFIKGYYHAWTNPDLIQGMYGFFAIGHVLGMIIGIALINIGYQRALKAKTDRVKYKRIAIFYTIGFLVIFMMIPWPFFHSWATWF